MSAATLTRSPYQEAETLWDALPDDLPAETYRAILERLTIALRQDDADAVRAAFSARAPRPREQASPHAPALPIPEHFCRDESVRDLNGWTFDGWRCRYCLRRTPGPDYSLTAKRPEVAS